MLFCPHNNKKPRNLDTCYSNLLIIQLTIANFTLLSPCFLPLPLSLSHQTSMTKLTNLHFCHCHHHGCAMMHKVMWWINVGLMNWWGSWVWLVLGWIVELMGSGGLFWARRWLWAMCLQWVSIPMMVGCNGGSLTDLGLWWVDLFWVSIWRWWVILICGYGYGLRTWRWVVTHNGFGLF